MKGTVLYGPRDIRFEDRETPKIVEPTDAIVRISLTCVCGSDLWPYRGLCRRLLGRPASVSGRLCHGEGATRGHRCRKALMLAILSGQISYRTGASGNVGSRILEHVTDDQHRVPAAKH